MSSTTYIQQAIRRAATYLCGGSASLVFILPLAGCSDTAEPLPEQEEIRFSTQWTETLTRATVDNTWNGENLCVSVDGTTKNYIAQGNALTPESEPFYWKDKNPVSISAYYAPVNGLKSTYKIETGQNKSDGFSHSDVLYAPPVTVDYGATALLTFHHLAALVNLNVTYSTDLGAINMYNADIKFENQQNVSGTVDLLTGTVAQRTLGTTNYKITPASVEGSSADVKKVRALLVPQCGYGIPFITVSFTDEATNAKSTYTYTPTESAPIYLEAGKQYTLNATLTRNGLELDAVSVNPWQTTTENLVSDDRTYAPSASGSPSWSTTEVGVTSTERTH